MAESIQLIWVDPVSNKNRFWRGFLEDSGDVVTEWGRVGYDEQTKRFSNAGRAFYEKKIKEKYKKGYVEIKTVRGGSNVIVSDVTQAAKSQIKAAPELQNLVERLVKANIHNITKSTSIVYDQESGLFETPLGIVTEDAIAEARATLGDLKKFFEQKESTTKQAGVLGQYLRLIPHNFGMRLNPANIINDTFFAKENDVLDSLQASFAAVSRGTDDTKAEVQQIFEVELDSLNDSAERQRIEDWFAQSKHDVHGYGSIGVKNVYKLKIKKNWDEFENKPMIKEVWHGTSEANILSILSSGLQCQPPSTAPIAGKLFLNGIYGATDSSKSLQYTLGRFGGARGQCGWMFVLDFSLQNVYYPTTYGISKLEKGYDSVWATKQKAGLRFDELIVYRNSLVRIKYLIEVG